MFCKYCGAEMSDTAKFCPKCGKEKTEKAIPEKQKIVEDNNVKYQLKPEFNIGYKILSNIGRAILYTFLICFLLVDDYEIFVEFPIIVLVVFGIMAIYVVIKMIFEKFQYNALEYNFYNTKVEYKDGFLNKEEKELKYKHIREITMSQSILERLFNIGTIKIFTNASSGGYNGGKHNNMNGRNGLYIHCITNVGEQYKEIKEIIDEGTEEE